MGTGCVSKSTIEDRRLELADFYATLPPAQRDLVDQGQISVGMSTDAVYIAWGKADEVVTGGDEKGIWNSWLYYGTTSNDYLYWNYYPVPGARGGYYLNRSLDRSVRFSDYVAAEILFREGIVEKWRTMPRPPSKTVFSSGGWVY